MKNLTKPRQKVASTPLFIPLESIRVASPCNADWNAMQGDDRSRFCGSCAKNVYNLSALTKVEAQALLLEKEGKLCVRYFQRPDGTLLTQDCPIGLLRADEARLHPQFALWANATALAMLVAALVVGALSPLALQAQPYESTTGAAVPATTATPIVTAEPVPVPLMGDVAFVPTAQPTPSPSPVVQTVGEVRANPTPVPTPHVIIMGKIKQADPPVCQKPIAAPIPPMTVTMGLPVMMGRPASVPVPIKSSPSKSKKSRHSK